MVEKEAATAARETRGLEGAVRRAMGRMALLTRPDRGRREREAEEHRVRLKADMTD